MIYISDDTFVLPPIKPKDWNTLEIWDTDDSWEW